MTTGWCEALGELVLATAATGADSRAITAAAAVMSFPFRVIPASHVKIGTVTDRVMSGGQFRLAKAIAHAVSGPCASCLLRDGSSRIPGLTRARQAGAPV